MGRAEGRQQGALPGCEELGTAEDTVERGKDVDEGSGLVLAVEGAEDAGDSVGALVLGGEGLGLRVVGVGLSRELGGDGEEAVEGAADGSLVLRGLLGAGDVLATGTAGLLAGLASLGTDVLEVLLADVAGVVFSVLTGGTM